MDIKTLQTFLVVARLKNFSLAAKELNSVQPTVSRHILDLEKNLNVKLFLRTTHFVELTTAGKTLLPEAINIIENDKRVRIKVLESFNKNQSSIHIGYLATACNFFLPKLMGEFLNKNPQIAARLHEMSVNEQKNALIENKIDLAFTRHLSNIDHNRFFIHQLYQDQIVVLLPTYHPLSKKSVVSIMDLTQEKFILFQRDSWLDMYEYIQQLCQSKGFTPDIIFSPENMRHLIASVSSGLGISIVPQCVQFVDRLECVCIPIKESKLTWPIYLYYKKNASSLTIHKLAHFFLESSDKIQQTIDSNKE